MPSMSLGRPRRARRRRFGSWIENALLDVQTLGWFGRRLWRPALAVAGARVSRALRRR